MRARLALFSGLAAGLLCCGPCSRHPASRSEPELLATLPADAEALLWVGDLAGLGAKVSALQKRGLPNVIAQLWGFGTAEAYVAALMTQLGVDLRSPEELQRAGIDSGRGLGGALLHGQRAVWVLGLSDPKALGQVAARLARDRLGASDVRIQKVDRGTLTLFSRPGAPEAELGLLMRERRAYLAAHPAQVDLAAFAALAESQSLAQSAPFRAALKRLALPNDAVVYLPQTSELGRRWSLSGATLAGALDQGALVLRADRPWSPADGVRLELPALEAPNFLGALPEDSFFAARSRGDSSALGAVWPALAGPRIQAAFQQSGFDVQAMLLDNFAPGSVASLSLAPAAGLGAGLPTLDVSQTNPFEFFHLVAVAPVRDVAKAQRALAALPAVAARLGISLKRSERAGQTVYLASYAQGEGLHLALKGSAWVAASPERRLLDALAKLPPIPNAGGAPGTGRWEKLLGPDALSAALDVHRLAESIRALPAEAWGLGGFALQAAAGRWLDGVEDLSAVALGATARDQAVQIELSMIFTGP